MLYSQAAAPHRTAPCYHAYFIYQVRLVYALAAPWARTTCNILALSKFVSGYAQYCEDNWYKRIGILHSFHQNEFKSSSATIIVQLVKVVICLHELSFLITRNKK